MQHPRRPAAETHRTYCGWSAGAGRTTRTETECSSQLTGQCLTAVALLRQTSTDVYNTSHTHHVIFQVNWISQLPRWFFLPHLLPTCALSRDRPTLLISPITSSHHVFHRCPRCLTPSTFNVVECLIQPVSSLYLRCTNTNGHFPAHPDKLEPERLNRCGF